MTVEPQLFERRIGELTRLIEAHLERGSLDEGNATAFDSIVDAWLQEEIARLDGAVTAAARQQAADRAARETERDHRSAVESAAHARWEKLDADHRSARSAVLRARQDRHDDRVAAARERLEQARTALAAAHGLLLGSPVTPAPAVTRLEAPDEGDLDNDDEKVA